jgi:beta-carotene 3-hydroxylase
LLLAPSYDPFMATELAVALLTLVVSEPVMAVVHRFVFHGPLWCEHESHHAHPTAHRIVRNDLLWVWPLLAAAALVTFGGPVLAGVGIGGAAYVAAYILAHDGVAHGRFWVPRFLKRMRVLRLLVETHHLHHRGGRHGGASPFAVYAAPLEHGWQVSEDFVPATKDCTPAQARAT